MNKKRALVFLGLLCGLIVFADFYLSSPLLDAVGHILVEGVIIVGGMAVLAGAVNVLAHNTQRMQNASTRPRAILTAICLVGAFSIGVIGTDTARSWMFEYILMPLQTTFAALLMFYVMEAVFLRFRARNVETAMMLGTCLILLMLQLPVSTSISPIFESLRNWLYGIPITFGTRGILIGIAIGIAIAAIKQLAGKNDTVDMQE